MNPFGGQTTTKQEPVHYNPKNGVVDTSIQTIKTHKEVGKVFADDHTHVEHKIQEDNKETIMQTFQNNVINAETNTIKIIFNRARLKKKFVQNVLNEADPQTLTI